MCIRDSHKILLGLAETGVMAKPRFVLNTSLACDANQLTFRRLARFWDCLLYTSPTGPPTQPPPWAAAGR